MSDARTQPLRDSLVLFVPNILELGGDNCRLSKKLVEDLEAHGLTHKLHYFPIPDTKPTPDMGKIPISIRVEGTDLTMRFAANEQRGTSSGVHYVQFNVLILPVYLLCVELYPTDFLAKFFKEKWLRSIKIYD